MAENGSVVNIGSRKSQLALIQTNVIMEKLKSLYPEKSFEIVAMSTTGDNIQHIALSKIGEKNLFTKELEIALENRRVALVVHSLKDLPSVLPPGMVIGAVFRRDDPHDVVIFHPKHQGITLATLPTGSVIGTSSLRRIAQLKRAYPHLKFEDVRGNLNTRLQKLDDADKYDALVLAAAGIHRMNWGERINQVLQPTECLYAVGQGALAVEVNLNDSSTLSLVSKLRDDETTLCCAAERAFLLKLEGGCSAPVGVHSDICGNKLSLTGAVLSLDGSDCLKEGMMAEIPAWSAAAGNDGSMTTSRIYTPHQMHEAMVAAETLGTQLAEALLSKGAKDILLAALKLNEKGKAAQ